MSRDQFGGFPESHLRLFRIQAVGAAAFQKGLDGVHAIAHPVGSWFDTHHGVANAVVLPYVMRHNRHAIAGKREVIARQLNLPTHSFDGLLAWVLELRRRLGIAHSLADIRRRATQRQGHRRGGGS